MQVALFATMKQKTKPLGKIAIGSLLVGAALFAIGLYLVAANVSSPESAKSVEPMVGGIVAMSLGAVIGFIGVGGSLASHFLTRSKT